MSTRKSDKMANWPIGKLLYSMSLPAVFSMLVQAMYNIVDTMYVSQLGEKALFAIGLVFPLQMLVLSIGLGTGAGVGTVVARRLGEKRYEEANKTATYGVIITFVHFVITAICGLLFSRAFLHLFTNDMVAIDMGHTYLLIVMGLCFGQMFSILFERILQSTGNMMIPMAAQLVGAITNIILDPIMIFGYFGLPAMGIAGAAYATVIGQVLGCVVCVVALFAGKHEIVISFNDLDYDADRLKYIYVMGLPVMIMNAIGSVTTTCLNKVLISFGENAVMALTLYFKVQSFVFMPVFGFNQGSLPILSYNYGAKNKERYIKTVKLFALSATCFLALGTIVFHLQTDALVNIFNASEQLLTVARVAFRIISLSFVLAGFTIVMTSVFQSLGSSVTSMFISILRQIGFLIPLAIIFGKLWGLNALWFAYPCAEGLVVIIFLPIALRKIKKAFN